MGIRFFCPNGHKLNVKEFQAGRRGICPFCGAEDPDPHAKHPACLEIGRPPGRRARDDANPGTRRSGIGPGLRFLARYPSGRTAQPSRRSRQRQDARPEHTRRKSVGQRSGRGSADPFGRRSACCGNAGAGRYGRRRGQSPGCPGPTAVAHGRPVLCNQLRPRPRRAGRASGGISRSDGDGGSNCARRCACHRTAAGPLPRRPPLRNRPTRSAKHRK